MVDIIGLISSVAGVGGLMFANGLYFIRYGILSRYCCTTGQDAFFFPGLDARLFRQLVEAVESEELWTVFGWINTLIPALAIGGAGVLFFVGCVLMRWC